MGRKSISKGVDKCGKSRDAAQSEDSGAEGETAGRAGGGTDSDAEARMDRIKCDESITATACVWCGKHWKEE